MGKFESSAAKVETNNARSDETKDVASKEDYVKKELPRMVESGDVPKWQQKFFEAMGADYTADVLKDMKTYRDREKRREAEGASRVEDDKKADELLVQIEEPEYRAEN